VTKGAIVQFPPGLLPIPNIIPFQYNPAKVRRSLEPNLTAPGDEERYSMAACDVVAPLSQPCDPVENITMEIELDASDDLEEENPIAQEFGVAPRIAALEKLVFAGEDLLSSLLTLASSLGVGAPVNNNVPVALLIWGIGRIVPIRVTSYSIEETTFMPNLRPLQATVSLSMQVLTSHNFREQKGISIVLAKAAYDFYRVQQEALALLNLANVAANVAGSVTMSIKL
jgi:hypothetical protein